MTMQEAEFLDISQELGWACGAVVPSLVERYRHLVQRHCVITRVSIHSVVFYVARGGKYRQRVNYFHLKD